MATTVIENENETMIAAPPRSPVIIEDRATVPSWVNDLESFRRWVKSDEIPERGRFAFLDGTIWVDLSMEQLFTHNNVKTECTRVLANLRVDDDRGYLFSDGTLYTNLAANLSTEPDALFVLYDSVKSGRLKFIKGAETGYVELEGSADVALEIISPTTERKDSEVLPELYWRAGVAEFWLVDVRSDLRFTIHNHTADGYAAQPAEDGWLYSAVFDRSFQLARETDDLGNPQFHLLVSTETAEQP